MNQIRHTHETRQRNPGDFEKLWNKSCKRLKKYKNATNYFHWKQASIDKNASKRELLDGRLAELWSKRELFLDESGRKLYVFPYYKEFSSLKEERSKIRYSPKITVDDILEIAIAYWIEARNAHLNQDHSRVSHALMECHFFLGIAHSPKTESEAKSEAGSKVNGKKRADLLLAIIEVMEQLDVTLAHNEKFLIGLIVSNLDANTDHREKLLAFDKSVNAQGDAEDSYIDRFSGTLLDWVTSREPRYAKIRSLYEDLYTQALQRTSPSRNKAKRKASS